MMFNGISLTGAFQISPQPKRMNEIRIAWRLPNGASGHGLWWPDTPKRRAVLESYVCDNAKQTRWIEEREA